MKYQALVGALAAGALNAVGCSAVIGEDAEGNAYLDATAKVEQGSGTRLFVPTPNLAGQEQVWGLEKNRDPRAGSLEAMLYTPRAVWLTEASPRAVKTAVQKTIKDAAKQRAVPVLVPYNLPFRDCAQYSAGGATTVDEYKAWIDAFVAGLGSTSKAIVILEPDSLGVIPYYNPFADRDGWNPPGTLEWCQPGEGDPATAASDRFALLNYAVTELKTKTKAAVYLDATHSGWLGAGDAADRLLQAGIQSADGFYLNASNYQLTERLVKYGSWISKCIYLKEKISWWDTAWCASQYSPANPDDFSTWAATDTQYDADAGNAGGFPADLAGLKHFVIDTSRNGAGPFNPARYGAPPYNQSPDTLTTLKNNGWCNPPGAGLGLLPQAPTDVPLVDAYLWIKVPGESDGACDSNARGWDYSLYNPWGRKTDTVAEQNAFDPLWGQVDPAAGEWFYAQALDLIKNANPPLAPAF